MAQVVMIWTLRINERMRCDVKIEINEFFKQRTRFIGFMSKSILVNSLDLKKSTHAWVAPLGSFQCKFDFNMNTFRPTAGRIALKAAGAEHGVCVTDSQALVSHDDQWWAARRNRQPDGRAHSLRALSDQATR